MYINVILLKAGKWSLQVIYDNFLFSQWTECAHILVDAQSAVCDAATLFSVLTQIFINTILLEDSSQSLQVICNSFLIWQSTVCPHPEGCCKCISWCSHMVLWVNATRFSGWRGMWHGKLPNREARRENLAKSWAIAMLTPSWSSCHF
jgi:hypothetical protein